MYKIIIISFLLLISTNYGKTQSNGEILSEIKNNERALKYYMIEAKKYLSIGNLSKAIESYNKCLAISPNSSIIHYELANIAMAQNDTKTALQHSRIAVKKDPKNKWFLKQLIAVMKARGLWGQVDIIYDKLISVEPKKEYFLEKLEVYKRLEEWEKAITVYTDIQNRFHNDFETTIGKQAIYSKLDKQEEAIKELKSLIKKNPNNGDFHAILALRYEEDNTLDKAEKIYKQLANLKNKGQVGIIILANHYIKNKSFKQAYLTLKEALTEDSSKPEMVVSSVVEFAKQNKTERGFAYSDTLSAMLVKNYPNNIKGYLMQAKHLKHKKEYLKAEGVLKDALEIDSLNIKALASLITIYEKQHDAKSLIETAKKGMIAVPEDYIFYVYKGVAEIDLKRYDEAQQDLKIGIMYAPSTKAKSIIKGVLAEAYFKGGKREKAYELYEDQLQTNPNNVNWLNNYSYLLSVAGERLDKAEAMIKKCLTISPDDIYFLDSYSWILFKQKKYKEALSVINKLFQKNADIPDAISAETYNHYGDILWKNGKLKMAKEKWTKALSMTKSITEKEALKHKISKGLR